MKKTAEKHKNKEAHETAAQANDPQVSIFNLVFSDEKNVVQNIGKELVQRMKYQQKFKQKEFLIDKNEMGLDIDKDSFMIKAESTDPRIQYFANCQKELEVALPILDKVYRKTLCLQDY